MALFRCKASGNVIEFTHEHDILSMRGMPHYEEVVEEKPLEEPKQTLTLPKKKQ